MFFIRQKVLPNGKKFKTKFPWVIFFYIFDNILKYSIFNIVLQLFKISMFHAKDCYKVPRIFFCKSYIVIISQIPDTQRL